MRPVTRYTGRVGGRLAFQVFGGGAVDLVFVPGFASHVDLQWADPSYARFLHRLGELARVVTYDKRGVGASDPIPGPPTLEQHVTDLLAVLEAADVDRAVVLGFSDGSPVASVFAATYPARCTGLVLCASFARLAEDDARLAQARARTAAMVAQWGQGGGLDVLAPSLAASRLNRANFALFERASLHPTMAAMLFEASRHLDVTGVLPLIDVPTLVLHRAGDYIPIEAGREVAARIPGARFVELTGSDHVPFAGDSHALLLEIESFLRAILEQPRPTASTKAVLFTDIVESTAQVAAVGDRRWREMIEAHDALSRSEIERHGGWAVKSTGDGWLAAFDGPAAAVRAGWAISEQVRRVGLETRAGVHVGPVEEAGNDLRGLTVHVAARVAAMAGAGQVLVSQAVRALLASTGFELSSHGEVELKGIPGRWELFALVGEPAEPAAHSALGIAPGLGRVDRAAVGVARRYPALPRAVGRLARPKPPSFSS